MNTNSRLDVWFGLMVSIALASCGGRSVLDDERPYGENGLVGSRGREILPLTSAPVDVGVPTTGGTVTTGVPGTSPTQTTTPTAPTGNTGTGVTMPLPTVNPVTTPVVPTATAVPTTTVAPTTSTSPTSVPTTDTTAPPGLPALVPFPPAGFAPNIPPELEGITWQDPWQCQPSLYDSTDYCFLEFACEASEYTSANCSLKGGLWYCDCQGNTQNGWVEFGEETVLQGEACRVAGALCVSDWPAEQGYCYEGNDLGRDYCSYSNNCNYALAVPSTKLAGSKSTRHYTYCSHSIVNGQEYVGCSCQYGSEFSVEWDPSTSCLVANDVCELGIDEGSQGDVECLWNSSSSDLLYCQEIDRCTQAATAGGNPIGLVSFRQTNCYLDGEDNWVCTCNYDGSDVRYYVADSGPEACQAAALDCPTGTPTITPL